MKNTIPNPDRKVHKLTDWEWIGLTEGFNIADGHAHQEQSPEYLKIVSNLSNLYLAAEKINQREVQRSFERSFFEKAGQKSYIKLPPPLYQAACSLSIEAVANYLRLTNKSTALLHPTFDNLADILKRHKIPMVAIEEEALLEPEKYLRDLLIDAIFLVCPNNPTGTEITKEQLLAIIAFCKKYSKLLILDCSFRFFSKFTNWDQYEVLYLSGVDFIVFEDTGKTWPTLELKIGITVASASVYPYLADITRDFLLNVSPFVFTLLTDYINANHENTSVEKIVTENRNNLLKALINLPIEIINPASTLSVAWVKLPDRWKATEFCKWLAIHRVHVLPGSPFFWNDPARGEAYIRIALLRPKDAFIQAIKVLRKATLAYKQTDT